MCDDLVSQYLTHNLQIECKVIVHNCDIKNYIFHTNPTLFIRFAYGVYRVQTEATDLQQCMYSGRAHKLGYTCRL